MPPRSAPVGVLHRVLAHLRSPPSRVRGRRPPRIFAAGAAARRTARETRRRSAIIQEDKHPSQAAVGFCRRCADVHRLTRSAAAETEAHKLMARIRDAGRLDFDSDTPDPRFTVAKMYEQGGGGKMLGVLIAQRISVADDKKPEASDASSSNHPDPEYVIIKAFSGQLYGEWRVPGWALPLCALTHDNPKYVAEHKRIAARTKQARGLKASAEELEHDLKLEHKTWDTEIQEVSKQVKQARDLRRARRREAEATTAAAENDEDEDSYALEHQLAEESRAGKRQLARLREEKLSAIYPSEAALAVAKEEIKRLRDEHRSMSASLLAEIFESYRLPNFRNDGGFGERLRLESDDAHGSGDTQSSLSAPTVGATLQECFVEDEELWPDASLGVTEQKVEKTDTNAPTKNTNLPCGCGDCCAPKLLAECALRGLKPLAIAEVWMGSATRKQGDRTEGEFYGACRGRCRPILGHMLCGVDALRSGGPIRV